MIAALFVEAAGVYSGRPDVDVWDEKRDARLYRGPWPVVCHSPCSRWGRYWYGGPSAKVRRERGDDGGCFAAAFSAVRRWGGVLEQPADSSAFAAFAIPRPVRGGWCRLAHTFNSDVAWTCEVDQGQYGHAARKRTWLFYVGANPPPALCWSPSVNMRRLDEGFHSTEERRAARAAGVAPRARLSTAENLATPPAFADLLLSIARSARTTAEAAE